MDLKKSESKKLKKWDGSTNSNSRYYFLRQSGLSHDAAVKQIERFGS